MSRKAMVQPAVSRIEIKVEKEDDVYMRGYWNIA
jgi:hypothetical protein